MKAKIITLIITVFFCTNVVSAYVDSDVVAQNYNKQGALALSNALKASGGEKRYFLKEAKWFYEKSVNSYSNNFEGFLGLARSYMYLGRFQKAYDNLMVAYNFNDKNPEANYYLGEYNYLNEKYFMALFFYREAIKNGYKNHYDSNYKTAVCYDKLGDAKKAAEYYNYCLQINPDAKEPKKKIEDIENASSKYKDYYEFY